MEASFLYRVAFPTRSLTIYSYLISSRTGFSAFFFALGLSLVLQLRISLISSMQFWSLCITNSSDCVSSSLPSYGLVNEERSELLTCIFLFGHSADFLALCFTCRCCEHPTDLLALDGPGCCWLSTDNLVLFSAASSGLLHLSFPSVVDLSICTGYVNCPSDLFVALSNLAFQIWCIFFCFLKTFFETFVWWSKSSISITMSSWRLNFFVYLSYKPKNKIKVTDKFPFIKTWHSRIFPLCKRVRLLRLFTINVSF